MAEAEAQHMSVLPAGHTVDEVVGFNYQLGVNPPADIASGRAHIVRWTMVLRRPKRSVDLQRHS